MSVYNVFGRKPVIGSPVWSARTQFATPELRAADIDARNRESLRRWHDAKRLQAISCELDALAISKSLRIGRYDVHKLPVCDGERATGGQPW